MNYILYSKKKISFNESNSIKKLKKPQLFSLQLIFNIFTFLILSYLSKQMILFINDDKKTSALVSNTILALSLIAISSLILERYPVEYLKHSFLSKKQISDERNEALKNAKDPSIIPTLLPENNRSINSKQVIFPVNQDNLSRGQFLLDFNTISDGSALCKHLSQSLLLESQIKISDLLKFLKSCSKTETFIGKLTAGKLVKQFYLSFLCGILTGVPEEEAFLYAHSIFIRKEKNMDKFNFNQLFTDTPINFKNINTLSKLNSNLFRHYFNQILNINITNNLISKEPFSLKTYFEKLKIKPSIKLALNQHEYFRVPIHYGPDQGYKTNQAWSEYFAYATWLKMNKENFVA